MSRFVIQWSPNKERWCVVDQEDDGPTMPAFRTLLEAETYVIERSERSER